MSDDIYRQKKITPEEIQKQAMNQPPQDDPLKNVRQIQQQIQQSQGNQPSGPLHESPSIEIKGNVPPQFQAILEKKQQQKQQPSAANQPQAVPNTPQPAPQQSAMPSSHLRVTGTDNLEAALRALQEQYHWEEFHWASKGKFYEDIPPMVHIRPMTGEEEQILATSRFVKQGKAIDMIFTRCIRENIQTEKLLSIDRTHLLIYLRGISYTPEYDVEVKCPNCDTRFATVIDLNTLEVTECPDDFDQDSLRGVLPVSKFEYEYRLSTGKDELEVSRYRDRMIAKWGDQREDDTLLFRTALLLVHVAGVTDLQEKQLLLKKLPVADLAHLRNEINEPPFGVDTDITLLCPACAEEFSIDLPMEASFFFPRKRTGVTHQ